MGEYLNLASIRPCTESEGPGKRFALWCQGCLNRCPGCCNPEMQALVKNHIVLVESLQRLILDTMESDGIEGVSFIGGEPFLQARGLSTLAKWCKSQNLTVLAFSGYSMDELRNSDMEGVSELLEQCDLLVDGRYDENLPDNERPWIGSKNQKLYNLSGVYPQGIEFKAQRTMELLISDNAVLINGWPFDVD